MNCPLCTHLETKKVYKNSNAYFQFNDVPFDLEIELCKNCGFLFQSSAYVNHDYDKLIQKAYNSYKKPESYPFPNRKQDNLTALSIITSNLPISKIINVLEVGSNRGDLLYLIKESIPHVNVLGIESTNFKELAIPTIRHLFDKNIFSNKFDVIIMQHVLEHIKNPKVILKDIRELLTENGILYIEVPNLETALQYNLEDFIPEHVSYFDKNSLRNLLEGYEIVLIDLSSHIRVLAKKTMAVTNQKTYIPGYDVAESLSAFINSKNKILQKILNISETGKKIVFYGASYYYRQLYKELFKWLKKARCYYFDDYYREPYEEYFGLQRLEKFDETCVVIICSNVLDVQQTISSKLRKINGLTFVRPWFSIETVNL